MSKEKEFLNDAELVKLHQCLLGILTDFVSYCDEHGLTYMLAYGSALGAYRHHGFIPWDDDIDIMMPRSDFNTLINSYNNADNHIYYLQSIHTEDRYYHSFAKIRRKGTCYIEAPSEGVYENNGVFIDIFPLDYVGDTRALSTKIMLTNMMLKTRALAFRACEKYVRENSNIYSYYFKKALFGLLLRGKTNLEVVSQIEKCLSKIKSKEYMTLVDSPYGYKKGTFPIEVLFPMKKELFEGYEIAVPGKIEIYLESLYGKSYMDLPPIEKRKTHKPLKLKIE